MSVYHLAFFIPVIFAFIGLEWWLSRKHQKGYYRLQDSVLNISCGILERGFQLGYYLIMLGAFSWLYEHARLFTLSEKNVLTWVSGLLLMDFLYYWHHRFSHEVNVLWGIHVSHHSSEEFNFTVGLRNSFLPLLLKTITWSVLPLLGFPLMVILFGIALNGIYQFFLHTRFFGSWGILEKVLVSPACHRVHHGCNEQYLDTNYGAVFMIWDHLFGTYQPENEEVQYGITEPLHADNPMQVYFHYWADLWRLSRREKDWAQKFRLWLTKPARTASLMKELPPARGIFTTKGTAHPASQKFFGYLLSQGLVAIGLMVYANLYRAFLQPAERLFFVILFITTGLVVPLLFNRGVAVQIWEKLRLLVLFGCSLVFAFYREPFIYGCMAVWACGSMLWWSLQSYQQHKYSDGQL